MSAIEGTVQSQAGLKIKDAYMRCQRIFYGSVVWDGSTYTNENGYYKFDALGDYSEHKVWVETAEGYEDTGSATAWIGTTGGAWSITVIDFILKKIGGENLFDYLAAWLQEYGIWIGVFAIIIIVIIIIAILKRRK